MPVIAAGALVHWGAAPSAGRAVVRVCALVDRDARVQWRAAQLNSVYRKDFDEKAGLNGACVRTRAWGRHLRRVCEAPCVWGSTITRASPPAPRRARAQAERAGPVPGQV